MNTNGQGLTKREWIAGMSFCAYFSDDAPERTVEEFNRDMYLFLKVSGIDPDAPAFPQPVRSVTVEWDGNGGVAYEEDRYQELETEIVRLKKLIPKETLNEKLALCSDKELTP